MQFGVRSAPVSRPAPVAPGPSDPSPAPTTVGTTKLIAMAIGIRAMTKWKAESYSVVAHNADPYVELTQGGVYRNIEGQCDLFLRCFTRIEIFSPKKAFLNWPPYGISSGGKWAPRRRGLSLFLGIIFCG